MTNPCPHKFSEPVLTPDLPRHGKVVCSDCGAFLRWLPKPETVAKLRRLQAQAELLKSKPLNDWEQEFLLSAEKQMFRLSPKQELVFRQIVQSHDC